MLLLDVDQPEAGAQELPDPVERASSSAGTKSPHREANHLAVTPAVEAGEESLHSVTRRGEDVRHLLVLGGVQGQGESSKRAMASALRARKVK